MNNKEIYLVVGHRGVGKTTWVKEIEQYFLKKNEKVLVFDIDQEVQNNTHLTIDQMFEKGENYFRKTENDTVRNCIHKAQSFKGKVFISLGAGYTGEVPSFCKVIHLKRRSDQNGRIFFDRPRILCHLTHFDEYQNLYSKRKLIYKQQRDFVFTRLDYFKSVEKWDKIFLGDEKLPFKNGVLILSEHACPSSQEKLSFFLDQKLKWGLKYFELKDDGISEIFLKTVLLKIPPEQILFSFRNKKSSIFLNFFNQIKNVKLNLDWPVEWGAEDKTLKRDFEKRSLIYSLHGRGASESLSEVLCQFPKNREVHLKLAVEIFSFKELWQGHLWWREDPVHRSFHPRSADGRWKWYRLLFGPHQPLYFIREDYEEGVLDQPVMAESVRCGKGISKNGFVCVLGNPVEHSATPFEQKSFFERCHLPIVPVLMKAEEVTKENVKILENFGMKFSAITTPLKKKYYQLIDTKRRFKNVLKSDQNSSSVASLNTLILTKKGWRGLNTDVDGALAVEQFVYQLGFHKITVWGGGAIRDVLEFTLGENNINGVLDRKAIDHIINQFGLQCDDILKNQKNKSNKNNISFYSARTGKLLKGNGQNPDVVIWAVGRSRMFGCLYPPQHWRPLYVIDLNYTYDSPGRGYAVKTKSKYVSGWLWFKAQAQAQRILFKKMME